jgi:hypothetical protein
VSANVLPTLPTPNPNPRPSGLRPDAEQQAAALADALADIIWQAGGKTRGVVASRGMQACADLNPSIVRDNLVEKVRACELPAASVV